MQVLRVIHVRDKGAPVDQLNELEYVDGDLLANVYRTNRIVRIDARSGEVRQVLDFTELFPDRPASADVMNGIAIGPDSGTFLVTGKIWPVLFQVRLKNWHFRSLTGRRWSHARVRAAWRPLGSAPSAEGALLERGGTLVRTFRRARVVCKDDRPGLPVLRALLRTQVGETELRRTMLSVEGTPARAGSQMIPWLGHDSMFDVLRPEPRFQQLMKRLHFIQ